MNNVIQQTAKEYEKKLQELEEEKTARSKETIENLQTLIRELNYIEEVNEDLTKQLENAQKEKQKAVHELGESQSIIQQLNLKIQANENSDNNNNNSRTLFKDVLHLVSPRSALTNSTPIGKYEKDNDIIDQLNKQKNQLVNELSKLKIQYSQAQAELEKERTKIQSIDLLLNQIKILTAPANTDISQGEAEEKRILLKKLLEEKEAHSQTLLSLNEERKKATNDREYIDSLSQRIKDLIQSHSNTLKQLEEEREHVRQNKEIIKELQTEIKHVKSVEAKRPKLLILNNVDSDSVEVIPSPAISDNEEEKKAVKSSQRNTLISSDSETSSGKATPTDNRMDPSRMSTAALSNDIYS